MGSRLCALAPCASFARIRRPPAQRQRPVAPKLSDHPQGETHLLRGYRFRILLKSRHACELRIHRFVEWRVSATRYIRQMVVVTPRGVASSGRSRVGQYQVKTEFCCKFRSAEQSSNAPENARFVCTVWTVACGSCEVRCGRTKLVCRGRLRFLPSLRQASN